MICRDTMNMENGIPQITGHIQNSSDSEGKDRENENTVDRSRDLKRPTKAQQTVLLCCSAFVNMTSTGFLYGLGVVYVDIIQSLAVSSTQASLIQSITSGMIYGPGILFGLLIDRFGPLSCIFAGSTVTVIGFVVCSFSDNIGLIVFFLGIISGSGAGVLRLASVSVVRNAFRDNAGLAMSFVTAGSGLAQIYVPYLFEIIIQAYAWRGTFLLYGGLTLNNLVMALLIKISSTDTDSARTSMKKMCKPEILQFEAFVKFLPCFLFIGASVLTESWFLTDFMVQKGLSREAGSVCLVVIGATGLLGRLLVWPLYKYVWFGVVNNIGIVFLFIAAIHFLYTVFDGYPELLLTSVLFGIFNGIYSGLHAMTTYELVGVEHLVIGLGIDSSLSGVAYVFGGPIGGSIKDNTGSYDFVFYFAAICSGLVTFICAIITIKQKTEKRNAYMCAGIILLNCLKWLNQK